MISNGGRDYFPLETRQHSLIGLYRIFRKIAYRIGPFCFIRLGVKVIPTRRAHKWLDVAVIYRNADIADCTRTVLSRTFKQATAIVTKATELKK